MTEAHRYEPYSVEGSGIGGLLGGCFAAGTQVWTPTGLVAIERVQVGDPIISFKPTGELVASKVVSTHQHPYYRVNRYTLWNAEFVATPNHHVLTEYNAYKPLQDFEEGECLVDALGQLQPLLEVSAEPELITVYNLTVEKWHNYLITERGIRVSDEVVLSSN